MKKILFVVGLLMLIGLTACSGQTNSVSPTDTIPAEYFGKTNPFGAEAVSVGAEIFKTNCASCHGAQGHGDGPAGAALYPAPKNLAELQTQVGDDYLFWRINTGKDGTSMIPWKAVLTEEQIWQVIAFLHSLQN